MLSPTLFNLYTHDIPPPTQPNTRILAYADDITVITQHPKHEIAAEQGQDYINILEDWLTTNRLKVSETKSTVTLVTPYNQEYNTHPHITLYGTPITLSQNPTILGVTYDNGMTFKTHTDNINTKAKSRLNVLRALSHTTYGHSKEDITTTYKQYIRPILTYAHTAWQPDLARVHRTKLQTTQNTALRIATCCTATSPQGHLHDETHVLPLKYHWDMRGTHIYNSTVDPNHPLHHMQAPTRTRRQIHNTPATHYRTLTDSLPPARDGESFRGRVHTHFAREGVASHWKQHAPAQEAAGRGSRGAAPPPG